MTTISLVLAIASLLAAILAFYRMATGDPAQKTRFLVLGIVLVGFTVLNTVAFLNG
jgi:hypothetical protein